MPPGSQNDAFAEFGKTILGEGEINAVVHAIAREDKVGLGFGEDARQALVKVGPWELAIGVARFAEAGDGLAGQSTVDDLESAPGILGEEEGLKTIHILAGVGDAIAEEDDAFGAGQKVRGVQQGGGEEEQAEQGTHGGI